MDAIMMIVGSMLCEPPPGADPAAYARSGKSIELGASEGGRTRCRPSRSSSPAGRGARTNIGRVKHQRMILHRPRSVQKHRAIAHFRAPRDADRVRRQRRNGMQRYDVVVLGGGSAGEMVATTVARDGKSVAVVEERLLGGECPYFACMPSKAMLHSAEIRHRISRAPAAGAVSRPLILDDGRLAYAAAAVRRYAIADRLDDSDRERELRALGVAVHRGRGRVVTAGALDVDGRTLGWTDLVVSVGTSAHIPEIEGLDRASTWTSEDFYTASELPESALVLGGGPVGCEIAQVLARFGARATIVQRAPRLIPAEEPAVAQVLAEVFRQEGIDL